MRLSVPVLAASAAMVVAVPSGAALSVELVPGAYVRDPAVTPRWAYFGPVEANGGNTSIRNETADTLLWKSGGGDERNGAGYYQRNRDLGQVVNVPAGETVRLRAVVLRTGRGNNAVMAGAPGAGVFLQVFRVEGEPKIDDNGTPFGTRAAHGWDRSYSKADDFLRGVRAIPMVVVGGGHLPADLPPTSRRDVIEPGHLRYLRFVVGREPEVVLEGGAAGARYALMVGFSEPGVARGLGLANVWRMENEPPGTRLRLVEDANGVPWWGVRREGDGTLPPTMLVPPGGGEGEVVEPARGSEVRARLVRESLFPEGVARWALEPTTDGYPDVCTYRTYEFYLEVEPVARR